jgi:hypothetical protein
VHVKRSEVEMKWHSKADGVDTEGVFPCVFKRVWRERGHKLFHSCQRPRAHFTLTVHMTTTTSNLVAREMQGVPHHRHFDGFVDGAHF